MADLDHFDIILIRMFLAENWSAFNNFCEESGDDAEAIYNKLDEQHPAPTENGGE